MMNYIWAGIIIFSFFFALLSGKMSSLSSGVLEGAAQAVNICLKLLGTLCLWNGISEIMKKAGIDKKLEKLLSLPVKLIFPRYSKTDAAGAITANIAANLLGLGNAATPLGIEAMRRMNNFNKSDTADNEIVRFVVINSAALTFLPTNIAALRRSAGSSEPLSILFPVWISGIVALAAGLTAEKILSKGWK